MAKEEQTAEFDGGHLANNNTSIFWQIEQGLRKRPHGAAVVCMHQPAHHLSGLVPSDAEFQQNNGYHLVKCLRMTYTQLHRGALRLVAGLIANDVQPGSLIVTLIHNGGEYSLLLWACAILRLTLAAVEPSTLSTASRADLKRLMETLKPDLIVVPNAAGAGSVDGVLGDLCLEPQLRISLDEGTGHGWKSLRDLAADAPKSSVNEEILLEQARKDDPHRIHSILFTSGTSAGRPKGCPVRVAAMTHILESQSWLINEDCSLVLQQAHNSRAIGPQHTLQTWRAGGAIVMPTGPSFAIEHTIDAILQHRVNFIVLSPAMVHALAQKLPSSPGALDSVRTIQVGGDAVNKEVLMKCASLFPNAKVCINHGMSEGGGFFKWPFFDTAISQIPYFGEICPTGAVTTGTRIRIWDADRGTVMRRGQPGELHISCESLIRQYLNGVGQSSFYVDHEGHWFNTGDIAIMNDEGLIYILGRGKDAIKRADTAIIPAALESCIEKYTGTQTAVVAVPHPSYGHEPFAVLGNFNGKSEEEIKIHVLKMFGQDYSLGGVASLKQLGLTEFPVNATHKIIKFEVQTAVLTRLNGARK